MNVEFRYANLEDLPIIVQTYNSTISSRLVTADLEPVTVISKLQWFNTHTNGKRPLWIITCNNDYAGWMSFNSFYGRPAYDSTVEVSIYLEEGYRGRGLGKHCLEKAIYSCGDLNIKNLLGFIFAHNETSLKLFKKFGFETWAHLPGVALMDGVERDLIILGKKIS